MGPSTSSFTSYEYNGLPVIGSICGFNKYPSCLITVGIVVANKLLVLLNLELLAACRDHPDSPPSIAASLSAADAEAVVVSRSITWTPVSCFHWSPLITPAVTLSTSFKTVVSKRLSISTFTSLWTSSTSPCAYGGERTSTVASSTSLRIACRAMIMAVSDNLDVATSSRRSILSIIFVCNISIDSLTLLSTSISIVLFRSWATLSPTLVLRKERERGKIFWRDREKKKLKPGQGCQVGGGSHKEIKIKRKESAAIVVSHLSFFCACSKWTLSTLEALFNMLRSCSSWCWCCWSIWTLEWCFSSCFCRSSICFSSEAECAEEDVRTEWISDMTSFVSVKLVLLMGVGRMVSMAVDVMGGWLWERRFLRSAEEEHSERKQRRRMRNDRFIVVGMGCDSIKRKARSLGRWKLIFCPLC